MYIIFTFLMLCCKAHYIWQYRLLQVMISYDTVQFVYGHFVYDTSSTYIFSTDISSTTYTSVQDSYTSNFTFTFHISQFYWITKKQQQKNHKKTEQRSNVEHKEITLKDKNRKDQNKFL